MDGMGGMGQDAGRFSPGMRSRFGRSLGILLLPLLFTACANTPSPPATGAYGVPPASMDATPKPPPATCNPEPFCMSDCKRQGYPNAYCTLRCGC